MWVRRGTNGLFRALPHFGQRAGRVNAPLVRSLFRLRGLHSAHHDVNQWRLTTGSPLGNRRPVQRLLRQAWRQNVQRWAQIRSAARSTVEICDPSPRSKSAIQVRHPLAIKETWRTTIGHSRPARGADTRLVRLRVRRGVADQGLELVVAGGAAPEMADAAVIDAFAPIRGEQRVAALRARSDRVRLTEGLEILGSQFHDASSPQTSPSIALSLTVVTIL